MLNGTNIRIKIVLAGDGGVGKTTLRRIWLGDRFKSEYHMTVGADFASKDITYYHSATKATYNLKFQVWDLAGQPLFRTVQKMYYLGSVGALCFFDITNQESYMNLVEWIQSFWDFNGMGRRPLLIVGSKSDLRGNPAFPNQVPAQYGTKYAEELSKPLKKELGFSVHYVETSAKENINVDEVFRILAGEILSSYSFKEKKEQAKSYENHRTLDK
jgi:small GTP-binding protein